MFGDSFDNKKIYLLCHHIDDSTLIELSGVYNKEALEFRELAALFSVRYFKVLVQDLKNHKGLMMYQLQDSEIAKIRDILLALKRRKYSQL